MLFILSLPGGGGGGHATRFQIAHFRYKTTFLFLFGSDSRS